MLCDSDNIFPELRINISKVLNVLCPQTPMDISEIRWLSVWCPRFTVNFAEIFIPHDPKVPRRYPIYSIYIIYNIYARPQGAPQILPGQVPKSGGPGHARHTPVQPSPGTHNLLSTLSTQYLQYIPHLVRTDKYFVSFSTCNPNTFLIG